MRSWPSTLAHGTGAGIPVGAETSNFNPTQISFEITVVELDVHRFVGVHIDDGPFVKRSPTRCSSFDPIPGRPRGTRRLSGLCGLSGFGGSLSLLLLLPLGLRGRLRRWWCLFLIGLVLLSLLSLLRSDKDFRAPPVHSIPVFKL